MVALILKDWNGCVHSVKVWLFFFEQKAWKPILAQAVPRKRQLLTKWWNIPRSIPSHDLSEWANKNLSVKLKIFALGAEAFFIFTIDVRTETNEAVKEGSSKQGQWEWPLDPGTFSSWQLMWLQIKCLYSLCDSELWEAKFVPWSLNSLDWLSKLHQLQRLEVRSQHPK